ncbi:hypothetical protein BU25DRAFT_424328 [Macroventuria anomochaeta]|uniref:Uncharacterized protein n=1 Tax=Macroventuria anomochaeta TaxID=301207 RepID=A0ACB6RTV3_9PLEO|nr:uncharacterized protein BU25DRAFT_424328 [Macroventuria anomochaeta]KAF2624247.1 hypothetical protein BU25DRAFT_424328 [Macroventuria anomochaeta]
MYKRTLLSLLFTTALALPRPQCSSPVPGICIPPVPYNSPWYDDWAEDQVRKWKEAQDKKNKDGLERDLGAVGMVVKAEEEEEEEEEEPMAGVYYCEDIAWGGACQHVVSPLGSDPEKCTMIDSRASSIGPDPGYYCIFYTNAFCAPIASDGSDTLTLTYPGNDNLGFTEKGDFNDRLLSYNCFEDEYFTLDPEIGTPPNVEEKME